MSNKEILDRLYYKYSLNKSDQDYLNTLIFPIIDNSNFKVRMTNEFMHHGKITLGEHILEDTIKTYVLLKKKKTKYQSDLAIKIALFHDLYTIPWQNNEEAHVHHFFSKHGFRHPVESAINAITWYPEIFENTRDAEIIIDGIIHHMFPFPVRRINKKIDKVELKNLDNYNLLSNNYKRLINDSLNRGRFGILSICHSKYREGRIMAKADRIVSRDQIKDISSFKALFTGHNKKLHK